MVVGSLLSFWDGLFSGAMLNFGRVDSVVFKVSRFFSNPSDNMFDTCHGAPEPQNFLTDKTSHKKNNATVDGSEIGRYQLDS